MRINSSTSKNYIHVVGYKDTQNAEMMLDPNPDQSECEQGFQDQQNASKKVKNQTSKYIGVSWNKDCKKWKAQLKHKGQNSYGGYFDNEEHAAMKVNLLCDRYETDRKNPTITIEPDEIQQVPNKTSIYVGVTWNKNHKCWQVQLQHNRKPYFGGYFDNEEHAAMKVNLLCEKFEQERKNPMITIESDLIQRTPNQTSIYNGVCWNKKEKKWQAKIMHKGKDYFGGYFDIEEHAAMKINLICDEIEAERKNPMINIDLNAIQKVPKKASIYIGVYWNKGCKKWQAQIRNNGNNYNGGYFDIEEHAAMRVNLLCDNIEIKRKNPDINIDGIQKEKSKMYQSTAQNIVNAQVKIEDENILNRFKDECEHRFIQSNNEEKCIVIEFQTPNAKRKRKEKSMINDDVKEEKMKIDKNELLEKISKDYTKIHD